MTIPVDSASAYQAFLQGRYDQAAQLFEAAITKESTELINYWYLGLIYLLQGHEDAAYLTWLHLMDEEDESTVQKRSLELAEVLTTEAQRLESLHNLTASWSIRQYLQEIAPPNLDNLLCLIEIGLTTNQDITGILTDDQLIQLLLHYPLETNQVGQLGNLLLKLIDQLGINPSVIALLKAGLPHIQDKGAFVLPLLNAAMLLRFETEEYALAVEIAELCLSLDPNNIYTLKQLSCLSTDAFYFEQGIEIAQQFCRRADTPALKVLGGFLLLRALLNAGRHGAEATAVQDQQEAWIQELIADNPTNLDREHTTSLPFVQFFFPYLKDQPYRYRSWQNQVAHIAQQNLRRCAGQTAASFQKVSRKRFQQLHTKRPLRIGYIAHTLRRHSVGWLSRWLFQHHNHDNFHISIYLLSQGINEFTDYWFIQQADSSWQGRDRHILIEQILQDQIDILVDLDSFTLDATAEVMALKPAPVQVTWLGADASGLPAIDYFIADPYVLPDNAQSYYQEKIWRLPQTYIAVDGFEIGVPTLRRTELDIPADAIIYLTAQSSMKRHPDTVRLQLKILKAVPNGYLLIKGQSDQRSIQNLFTQIAEEEGVDPKHLRFLGRVANETVHRANLGIADVILDTYPYNGATTTLEALWVGVPLVTRVGQQFAARNSYAFLTNAGVSEGIAWTDQEYIDWGVRLGKDQTLRQQVAFKLKASRQTSPLWNARQFTREMENAYQQMWQAYLELDKNN